MDLKWPIYYRLDSERNFSRNDEIYEIYCEFRTVSMQLRDEKISCKIGSLPTRSSLETNFHL